MPAVRACTTPARGAARVVRCGAVRFQLAKLPQILQGTVQREHVVPGRSVRLDSLAVGAQQQPDGGVLPRPTHRRAVLKRARGFVVPQEVMCATVVSAVTAVCQRTIAVKSVHYTADRNTGKSHKYLHKKSMRFSVR